VTSGVHPDLRALGDLVAARGLAIGKPLEVMDETDSTNDVAKRAAKLGAPHGALFVAESQRAGRGRQGRPWVGVRGESILMSVLLRLSCDPRKLPPVALAVGLAARDAIAVATGADVRIKWPNDVLIGGKKVAGVLVEAIVAGSNVEAVVVGVGVNVHQRTFPPEIADRATSVALHAETPPDRATLLADLLAGIDREATHVAARGLGLVHARITAADALAGRAVDLADARVRGVACGIDLDGALRVRTEDGTIRRVVSGEVT
jgi:BirA family biotin operon repressor/biotin-[acetyl-CoA-carboxylase] ligase